jgi:predicted nucleic acid-binding protein
MRILFGTNILLRLTDTDHPTHHVAKQAVSLLETRAANAVLVPQVLYEYWAVATRRVEHNGLGRDIATVTADIADYTELFRLLRDERGIFEKWRELVTTYAVHGKPTHDARLVAAMQRHGISNLLTFNTADFQRFTGLRAFSPADILGGLLPA